MSRDPKAEGGGLDLYGFVGNDPITYFDVLGFGVYVEGSTPPPNSQPLDRSTWNTMEGDFGDIQSISTRAVSTVIAGYLMGWSDAAAHLRHFLLNSGKTYTIRFKGMNEESTGARSHYISEINDALAAAERLTQNKPSVDLVTVAETSGENSAGNWLYAVGLYRTWAKGTAKRCDDNYELQWSFNFRDNYD